VIPRDNLLGQIAKVRKLADMWRAESETAVIIDARIKPKAGVRGDLRK